MFRDQSESVIRKARSSQSSSSASTPGSLRRQGPARPGRTPLHGYSVISSSTASVSGESEVYFGSDSEHQFMMRQPRQSPLATRPHIGLSRQEAICFFLQSHTIPGTSLMTDSLTTFLMQSSGSLGQQAIQSSIVAVASAMLSRVQNVKSLRQAARQEYGSALKLVNEALADAEEAKTDQTLGAVIFLSLYEVSAPSNPSKNVMLILIDRYLKDSTGY